MSPVSGKSINQVGAMYVDDKNLWAGMKVNDDRLSVAAAGQSGINSWGRNLSATAGGLNSDKCAFTIHDMSQIKEMVRVKNYFESLNCFESSVLNIGTRR